MGDSNMRVAEALSGCALNAGTVILMEALRFQKAPDVHKPQAVRKVEPIEEGKCSHFPCHFLSRGQYQPCRRRGGTPGVVKVDLGEITGQLIDWLI